MCRQAGQVPFRFANHEGMGKPGGPALRVEVEGWACAAQRSCAKVYRMPAMEPPQANTYLVPFDDHVDMYDVTPIVRPTRILESPDR